MEAVGQALPRLRCGGGAGSTVLPGLRQTLGEAARKPAVGQTVDRPPDPRAEKCINRLFRPSAAPRPALPRVEPIDLSPALPPPLPPRRPGTASAALAPLAVVLFVGLFAGAYRFMVLPTLQTAQRLKENPWSSSANGPPGQIWRSGIIPHGRPPTPQSHLAGDQKDLRRAGQGPCGQQRHRR